MEKNCLRFMINCNGLTTILIVVLIKYNKGVSESWSESACDPTCGICNQ